MRYAETGHNLEIYLSTGSILRMETDPRLTELHLGGLGTSTQILWDRVPPEVGPFSDDNLLIFSSGLLCGTTAAGANRTIISTISPQTQLIAYSMMGGYWAPELKYAGYDKVIIRGRSPSLVYLWIDNDRVEVHDASHLRGKGSLETIELIRDELKEPNAQVVAIGLAGESRCYFASIETTRGSASRLGMGAVMGDKNLKAIVVRGTKDVFIARPLEFMELCNEVLKNIQDRMNNPLRGIPPIFATVGYPGNLDIADEAGGAAMGFAWGNARHPGINFWNVEVVEKWREVNERVKKRLISCYNCPSHCAVLIDYANYPNYILKCFTKLTYALAAMSDLDFSFRINAYAHEYGVDAYTTPQVIAFAVELYTAGILTDRDMPGFPSGKDERFFWLLDRIVRREGIGDILADGIYLAARKISRGAEAYDHNTIKKHEQLPIKQEVLNPIAFLMWATGEKINITQFEGQIPRFPLKADYREEFVKDWLQLPHKYAEKFRQFILEWEPTGEHAFPHYPDIETTCELVDWVEIMHHIDDATGLCAGLSSFSIKPPYHIHNLPRIISAATGMDIGEDKLWEIARRNRNLLRATNVRRGLRRKDECPPQDHWKQRFPNLEAALLDAYYKFKGWDRDGIPARETLQQLGLDYVREDFERRVIYSK